LTRWIATMLPAASRVLHDVGCSVDIRTRCRRRERDYEAWREPPRSSPNDRQTRFRQRRQVRERGAIVSTLAGHVRSQDLCPRHMRRADTTS
jgi:hypothetical protein